MTFFLKSGESVEVEGEVEEVWGKEERRRMRQPALTITTPLSPVHVRPPGGQHLPTTVPLGRSVLSPNIISQTQYKMISKIGSFNQK